MQSALQVRMVGTSARAIVMYALCIAEPSYRSNLPSSGAFYGLKAFNIDILDKCGSRLPLLCN